MEAIYAVDLNNGLSKDGIIPWTSKKDLSFFMKMTISNVVIMGKNTYLSLPNGPLRKRLNIVLTRQPDTLLDSPPNVIFTNHDKIYEDILHNREKYSTLYPFLHSSFKVFIIGGKQIYQQLIPLCETIWVTRIKKDYSCELQLDYDYSREFTDELVEEDDELIIIKYKKK